MQLQIASQLAVGLEKRGLCVESYAAPEISEDLVNQITDFYRYIFNNNGNYLVFPTTLEFLSPAEVFDQNQDEIIDLVTMDSLTEFPIHPQTGEQAIFWHDPEQTLKKISTKLKQDAQVAILRDLTTANIEGLCFGNKTTVRQQFEAEGWRNPLDYAAREITQHNRDFPNHLQKLRAKMQQHSEQFGNCELAAEDAIYSWNCLTTSPKFRGIEILLALTSQFFAAIPEPIKQQLPVISEVRFQSTSHSLLTIAGYLDVPGILTDKSTLQINTDSLIVTAPLSTIAQNFSLPPREFRQLARKRRKEQLKQQKAIYLIANYQN